MKEQIVVDSEKRVCVPLKIFTNRKLSVLECVVNYLKGRNYSNVKIAELLNKNSKNIWTLYSRVLKKNRK